MNLACGVSTLAWPVEFEAEALSLLSGWGVSRLELAPARYWGILEDVSLNEIREKCSFFEERGFRVLSFQAFFFGRPELQFLGDSFQSDYLPFFRAVLQMAVEFGATYLVFGAPKNRLVPVGMTGLEAWDLGVSRMRLLGEEGLALGISIGVEANPPIYGGNFLMTSSEVCQFVRAVDHSFVHWHVDTGAFALEGLRDFTFLDFGLAGSLHVSEPSLGDFFNPWGGHVLLPPFLGNRFLPVLEMLPVRLDWRVGLGQALGFMKEIYV